MLPRFFTCFGIALAMAVILTLTSPSFSSADSTTILYGPDGKEIGYKKTIQTSPGGDSTTIYYDNHGNETGYQKNIQTGPVQMPAYVAPKTVYDEMTFEQAIQTGYEAYNNKFYEESFYGFQRAVTLKPWDVESWIGFEKTFYLKARKSLGEDYARKQTLYQIDSHIKETGNEAFVMFKDRFINNKHFLEFSIEAFNLYQNGMEAYKREDYMTASKFLRQSVKKDPWSYDAWFYYSMAEMRTNGKQKYTQVVKEAKKFHPNKNF